MDGDPRASRRLVAVLLTDVVDSTSIAERLGPERSKFLFDEIASLFEASVVLSPTRSIELRCASPIASVERRPAA